MATKRQRKKNHVGTRSRRRRLVRMLRTRYLRGARPKVLPVLLSMDLRTIARWLLIEGVEIRFSFGKLDGHSNVIYKRCDTASRR